MAEVTFGGLATGLPTEDIITKLMAIERRPLDNLEADKTYETNRLKAYGQLNTRLNELREAVGAMNLTSEVRTTKATVSSESAFTATSTNALPGSYNIVVKQLAQVQKDVSTDGYASNSAGIFGTGTVTVNGTAISLDATNNSLQGLSAAINEVAEKTGVSASIINDGSGGDTAYHLVLTGKDASTAFTVTSDLKDGSGVAIPFATTSTQVAQQAQLTVDGIEVSSNSNIITGVIAGVTLNLNAASPIPDPAKPTVYTTTKLDIVADPSALKEKISTFVSSYNKVMEWIVEGYADKTDADTEDSTDTETDKKEDVLSDYLRGDATVNTIKRGLQSLLTDVVKGSGSLHVLGEIGISTAKDGTLLVNNTKLDAALENGLDNMTKLLAGEDGVTGVMQKFNSYLLDVTSATQGMYAEKRDRYESRVERMDLQITQKTTLIDKMETRLKARFNAMELLISNLNSQSSYLTQLSNLANSENN